MVAANVSSLLMQQSFQNQEDTQESYSAPFEDPNNVPRAPNPTNLPEEYTQASVIFNQPTRINDSLSRRTELVQANPYTNFDNTNKVFTESQTCLANACGNCALAYGNPLQCALLEKPVNALEACKDYLSPFQLIK